MKHLFKISALNISIIIAVIMYLLSTMSINIDFLDPFEMAISDLDLTDLTYTTFSNNANIEIDTSIVLVNIGSLTRKQIAQQINNIQKYSPKAIGIDARFAKLSKMEQDLPLAQALRTNDNITIVNILERNNNGRIKLYRSHDLFAKKTSQGFANLIEDESFRTIRTFHPFAQREDTTLLAFGTSIVKQVDTNKYQKLLDRNNEIEVINYLGNHDRFFTLGKKQALDGKHLEFLKDKIVLVGYLGENVKYNNESCEDKFYTPLNQNYVGRSIPDMYGVVIHANIISMILNSDFIEKIPAHMQFMLVLLLLYFNSLIMLYFYNKMPTWYNLASKLFIIIESALILFLVIVAYMEFNIKVNIIIILISIIILPDLFETYIKVENNLTNKWRLKK